MKKNIFLIWPGKKTNQKREKVFPLWAISIATYLKKNEINNKIHILDGQIHTQKEIIKKKYSKESVSVLVNTFRTFAK